MSGRAGASATVLARKRGTALLDELVGYLASPLVVLSLVMAWVLRLRIIGFVGAVVLSVDGVLIGSVPVIVTNVAIILVHGYHLSRILRDRSADAYFEVLRWPISGVYLPRFLAFHAEDIRRSQPGFAGLRDDRLAWVVLRDAVPVGLVLARHDGSGTAHIDLDDVTPEHRDFTAGTTLFDSGAVFAGEVGRVLAVVAHPDDLTRAIRRRRPDTVVTINHREDRGRQGRATRRITVSW
ncbi:MAG: hypothetical protein EA388_00700 [Nitriliruptor sp.]|nr:MAG: hypothetical protein EA388_00700 [Nitriliruptor sp.]